MSFFFKVVTTDKETQKEQQRQMLMVPIQAFSKTKVGPVQGLTCKTAEATPSRRRRMHLVISPYLQSRCCSKTEDKMITKIQKPTSRDAKER